MARLNDIKQIEMPIIHDVRGNLSVIESSRDIPFDIKRIYYLYDVPEGAERGGHAHYNLQQFILPLSGSFDILLDDGLDWKRIRMDSCNKGILLPTMIWRELVNFEKNTVCLVLASEYFTEQDYIRNYNDFLSTVRRQIDIKIA